MRTRSEPSRVESPSKIRFSRKEGHSSVIYRGRDGAKPRISVTQHGRAVNYRVTNCLARGDIFTCGLRGKIITIRPRKICYVPQLACFYLVILKIKINPKIIYRGVFQQF